MKKRSLIFVLFTALVSSCYSDNEERIYGTVTCSTTPIRFTTTIMPLVSTTCAVAGCHVQGGNGPSILQNYTQIKAIVDNGSFYQRVVVQKDMPPSSPLTACQIQYITQWIKNGALNN